MNRRTTCMLTRMTVLGLAITALPQASLAQSDPLAGLWQLNLTKSKYSPGPAPKSLTLYVQGEGQNRKATGVGIDAAGNAISIVFMEAIEDGKPHPVIGLAGVEASASTRVDAHTANVSYFYGGQIIQTGTIVTSQDGKTLTFTIAGARAGQQMNNTLVYDRQ
jgi:hypothetical protein